MLTHRIFLLEEDLMYVMALVIVEIHVLQIPIVTVLPEVFPLLVQDANRPIYGWTI
jgi:hypothetical protein